MQPAGHCSRGMPSLTFTEWVGCCRAAWVVEVDLVPHHGGSADGAACALEQQKSLGSVQLMPPTSPVAVMSCRSIAAAQI
jgi:hypothetical protein